MPGRVRVGTLLGDILVSLLRGTLMGLQARLALYKKVEARRKRPLIVYVTSNRVNANSHIAADSVPELLDQLQRLPAGAKELDLLIVSDGGDPTVAWRIVSLIRERATKFSALVPQAAYSAATLIVLGADEVVMHPNGNLPLIHRFEFSGEVVRTERQRPLGSAPKTLWHF